jgi:Putative Flp pilus-assembly TadE/G-like
VRRARNTSGGNGEQGIVITLVALFVLFVVGAMAALSIDVVTLYTARSEAQLAADGAALAGARVLANSGMTSKVTDTNLATNAEALAVTVATQVATHNLVGGRTLNAGAGEVDVSFSGPPTNPRVTVHVSRADLPTFFARIWGSTQVAVAATATAEAYNPSGANALGELTPVAPTCVKPWLLPNVDPSSGTGSTIFDAGSGTITNPGLLGWSSSAATPTPVPMSLACVGGTPPRVSGDCTTPPPLPGPSAWQYYPGADATFSHPTQSLPSCTATLNNYQMSIAGCVQTPISCNSTAQIDTSIDGTRNLETANAVNCLTRATPNAGDADQVDLSASPSPPPFQFLAGNQNPVAGAVGSDVLVSSSLVTVPVFDVGPGSGGWKITGNVQIIGFVQLFLSPDAVPVPVAPPAVAGNVNTTVINMAGCGSSATGTPIQGNGASPVAVRLVAAP